MKRLSPIQVLFLVISIIGIAAPYSQMPAMLADGEYSLIEHFAAVYATPETAFFGWDLAVTGIAFLAFMLVEIRRNRIPFWWISLLGTFMVGISFGLPFFLFLRSRAADSAVENRNKGEVRNTGVVRNTGKADNGRS
ncbi:DUF2834 domain-containing protein [Salinispira pacifica]|uniref:DUF2834 domain-containing protein n=1 Tax=Salinispira pacifica TaxID=1307761 RepID=V5WKV1_9SPIO|nr:DUF2834 domain-containing protein [Salinispira pacifica]AHC16378.1 hypothetical protein L21SP2_3034 [Salinispira pacifica]